MTYNKKALLMVQQLNVTLSVLVYSFGIEEHIFRNAELTIVRLEVQLQNEQ